MNTAKKAQGLKPHFPSLEKIQQELGKAQSINSPSEEVSMRKAISFLLVFAVLLLASAAPALAKQQKTKVCHQDENGTYKVIEVAGSALKAHLAHGDLVVGEDVDENCQPLSLAQTGCFLLSPGTYGKTDGSNPQFVGSVDDIYVDTYEDASCTSVDGFFHPQSYLIWAATQAAATSRCNALPDGPAGYTKLFSTLTTNLYICTPY